MSALLRSHAVVVGRQYSEGRYMDSWNWASPPWYMFILPILGVPLVFPSFLMPPPPISRYVPGQPYFIIRMNGVDHWMLTNDLAYRVYADGTRLIVEYELTKKGEVHIVNSWVG